MLHPAGPDTEEEDDEGEEEDQVEHSEEEEGEKRDEDEGSFDIEEYKHAILELEGLKVSDSQTDTPDESKQSEGEEEPETTPTARSDEEMAKSHDEELIEAEDECPELLDLSAANKEFKPFRSGID